LTSTKQQQVAGKQQTLQACQCQQSEDEVRQQQAWRQQQLRQQQQQLHMRCRLQDRSVLSLLV
jgi:hypothetical protein